jgi:hypothetical protein
MKRADAWGPNLHPSSQSYRPVILPRDGASSRQPRPPADDCTQNAQIKEPRRPLRTWLAPIIFVVGFQGFVLSRGAGAKCRTSVTGMLTIVQ